VKIPDCGHPALLRTNHEASLDQDRWRNGSRRHCIPDTLHRSNRSDSANGTGSRSLRTHYDSPCLTANPSTWRPGTSATSSGTGRLRTRFTVIATRSGHSTERQRWFVYETFGHAAASLSNPVSPAEDERDNILNVLAHAQVLGNAVYEFLPALSRGNGVPTRTPRAGYTTMELNQGVGKGFRGGARRGAIKTGGRDALLSNGRGRQCAVLRPPASARKLGGHSR
jgi:hypothetical protein